IIVLTFFTSPARVNGSVVVNWLPNGVDAELWNQALKVESTFPLTLEVPSVSPDTGVNCKSICVIPRPVAKPVTSRVRVLEVLLLTCTLMILDTDCATEIFSAGGIAGVILIPPSVRKEGVSVIVPATVPVCRRIWFELFGNTAWVAPAGMTKVTVRPPVANCTAGSLLKTSELKASVSVPLRFRG